MRIGLPATSFVHQRQHRFFSVCVIVSVGVGISSASGVIAIVDSMRYGPLPFNNADRLEHLFTVSRIRSVARVDDVPAIVFRALRGGTGLPGRRSGRVLRPRLSNCVIVIAL